MFQTWSEAPALHQIQPKAVPYRAGASPLIGTHRVRHRVCYPASSPNAITVIGLQFTTLGGKYPRQDFHLLESCHARHTFLGTVPELPSPIRRTSLHPAISKQQHVFSFGWQFPNDRLFFDWQILNSRLFFGWQFLNGSSFFRNTSFPFPKRPFLW